MDYSYYNCCLLQNLSYSKEKDSKEETFKKNNFMLFISVVQVFSLKH